MMKPIDIDVKRFYIPGVVLKSNCPQCKDLKEVDLGDDYLSYPKANTPIYYQFCCNGCDVVWVKKILLTVKVEML